MRKLILIMFSAIGIAQTNPTSFSKIKVTNQTKNNNATRVVVQDSITKEFHWVLKSNLGGGSTTVPTLQQVTLSGNNITNNIITTGYYSATNYLGGGMHGFVNLKGSGLEIGTNANRNAGSPFALIKSDNLLSNRNFQLPDEDGTIATREWVNTNSGTIPTWHQTLTAGNITNIGAVSGVKAFEVTSPNTGMSFFGETILTSNASKQAEYGLNGFIHKLNDNTQRSKLSYDGLELKTNITGGVATIKSDNLTTPVTLQLPTTSGTLALTNDTTPLLRVANSASIPLPSEHAGGVILLVEDSKKMYRNDGTKWQGL